MFIFFSKKMRKNFPLIFDTKYLCQLFEKGEINNYVEGLAKDLNKKNRLEPFNNTAINKGSLKKYSFFDF